MFIESYIYHTLLRNTFPRGKNRPTGLEKDVKCVRSGTRGREKQLLDQQLKENNRFVTR
jgi:hypothetical protein